jgi:hypothetical protein
MNAALLLLAETCGAFGLVILTLWAGNNLVLPW